VQLDPRNRVQPVPGRFSHGPRMLALEGFALLFERTGEPAWLEKAAAFVFHILERHVNRGRFPALQPLDFYEAVDARGNPWTENNVVLSDPGHALEFLGLATRDLLLLESHPELAKQFAAFLGSCREMLPGVFAQNFLNGFQPVAAGICKAYDLVARTVINSDMPWWSLPETLRAGALLLKFAPRAPERPAILAALRDCSNAFLTAYVNPAAHLMAYQTRDGRGRPADVVPATPDADPGFHTGLSVIDYMKALG
jgi:mannose/cellobiose epimerase-like protein (N-acyl-D-glucosamine 2-epimerase family)